MSKVNNEDINIIVKKNAADNAVILENASSISIHNLIIEAKGELNGKQTNTARYFFDELSPNQQVEIERLTQDLTRLNNVYKMSYEKGNDVKSTTFTVGANA